MQKGRKMQNAAKGIKWNNGEIFLKMGHREKAEMEKIKKQKRKRKM